MTPVVWALQFTTLPLIASKLITLQPFYSNLGIDSMTIWGHMSPSPTTSVTLMSLCDLPLRGR